LSLVLRLSFVVFLFFFWPLDASVLGGRPRGRGGVFAVVMGESFAVAWASTASGLVLPFLQSTCKLHSRQDAEDSINHYQMFVTVSSTLLRPLYCASCSQ